MRIGQRLVGVVLLVCATATTPTASAETLESAAGTLVSCVPRGDYWIDPCIPESTLVVAASEGVSQGQAIFTPTGEAPVVILLDCVDIRITRGEGANEILSASGLDHDGQRWYMVVYRSFYHDFRIEQEAGVGPCSGSRHLNGDVTGYVHFTRVV